jgi:hypothetical protein
MQTLRLSDQIKNALESKVMGRQGLVMPHLGTWLFPFRGRLSDIRECCRAWVRRRDARHTAVPRRRYAGHQSLGELISYAANVLSGLD